MHCPPWQWWRVWLHCVSLAVLILAVASRTSKSGQYYGSGSGAEIPMFPTETVVGFEKSSIFAREGGRSAEVCAVIFEPYRANLTTVFTVQIFTEDGLAKAGEDYESVSMELGPFNNTSRRHCVDIPLIDDRFCESHPHPEDFSVSMTTSDSNVTVTPQRIGVAVDDRYEPECINICVGFEMSTYITIEEIGYFYACVTVQCPERVEREIFVTLTTTSVTAEADRDFVPLSHVPVGPLGPYSKRRCVPVEIINDGDCEKAERFYLTLATSEPLVTFTTNNAPVVIDGTTEYDDCASVRVGFVQTRYSVGEGDETVMVCVGAFEPDRFGARFNVTVNTRDGTLNSGTDYRPLEGLIVGTFDRSRRRICFSVGLINDNICGDDPGRFFHIDLSSYADRVDLNPYSTRIYVYDAVECTQVRVGLPITTFTVQEDELVAAVCATVFSPPVLERSVDVLVNTADASAVEGDDYIGLEDQRITFSEDAQTVCFNVTIMNDGDCEPLEFFTVSMSSSAQRVLVTPFTGYVIIRDPPFCTGVQVSLAGQLFSTYEGAGEVEVCVRIEVEGFPTTQPFTLLVSTQDGSARAPSDYTALSDQVIGPFDADNSEVCFAVSIVQDSVCEGEVGSDGVPESEVFSAVVRSEDGSGVEVNSSGRIATITIEDSAVCIPVVLGFEQPSYTVRETEETVELMINVTAPAVLRRDVTLMIETVSGTAIGNNTDYESLSQSLGPFSEDRRSLTVSLLVTNDNLCDSSPTETLTVRLNTSDPNINLTPAVATVTILDSPQCTPGTVTFEQSSFVSSEELGWAVVCASLSGSPPTSPFSLALSSFDITANAGEDYVSVSSNLTFGPDTTQQCVLVLLVQDRVCESTMTESFGVRLTSMGSRPAEQDTTNVVIYDSPECITVRVQFEEVVYALTESSGAVQVCAVIVNPAVAEREFFLQISSSDRDAIAGADYVQLDQVPLGPFSLTQRRSCARVEVMDDAVCEEPEESLSLRLTSEEDFIDISRDSVTVYIEDAAEIECVQVSCGFESTGYVVQETAGQVLACVSVPTSQRLMFDFNLTILSVSGTATGGQDFVPVNQQLMFGPGQQRQCVAIAILNDEECEDRPNEQFTLIVRGNDPRCILSPNTLTVTIDDAGLFGTTIEDPDCFPLEIYFTDNTPRVSLDSIQLTFSTRGRSLPQTISCDLINSRGDLEQTIDCTSGQALFTNISRKGFYTVRATVITGSDAARTEVRVRYDPDPAACSAHLVNRGLIFFNDGRARAEFVAIGPFDSLTCTLNNEPLTVPCISPIQLSGLEDARYGARYKLRVTPVGDDCSTIKKLLKKFVYVEPYPAGK